MPIAQGMVDGFEIYKDDTQSGNMFYINELTDCGTVYYPSVEFTHRVFDKYKESFHNYPHGSMSLRCVECKKRTGIKTYEDNACRQWIDSLLSESKLKNKFIKIRRGNNIFSSHSYINLITGIDGKGKLKREQLKLGEFKFGSEIYREFSIDPQDVGCGKTKKSLNQGDFLEEYFLWGEGLKGTYVDKSTGEIKNIGRSYWQVMDNIKIIDTNLEDATKAVKYKEMLNFFKKKHSKV